MKIFKNKNIEEQRIEDELIIYVPITDSIVWIDANGTMLWDFIEDGIGFDELLYKFYMAFDDKPSYEQFIEEIDEVLSEYVKCALITYTRGD